MENLSALLAACLLPPASCYHSRSMETYRLMIVAGEASGDAHAAALVRALREAKPEAELNFFGATGPLLREAGVETIVPSDELAILGLLEIGRALPKFWRAYKLLKQAAIERQADAVILVDWPDFNLKLARSLHRRGVKVIYYISPQLWAWRSYRARSIERDVDLLLSILPFEQDWYADRGIDHVEFVGHPLAGEVRAQYDRAEFCRSGNSIRIRRSFRCFRAVVVKKLNAFCRRCWKPPRSFGARRPEVQFVVVVAPSRSSDELREIIRAQRAVPEPLPSCIHIVSDSSREALAASDAIAVASGTATLEAALLGTPMVVVYKESLINWHTLGRLITSIIMVW